MSAPTVIKAKPNPWTNQSGVPIGMPVWLGDRSLLKAAITFYYACREGGGKGNVTLTSPVATRDLALQL